MKWQKTKLNAMNCFISDCGEYKVINYGGKIFAFYKINSEYYDKDKKRCIKCRMFGDSCEIEYKGTRVSKTYKTYREAFAAAERHKAVHNENYKRQ